jgi:hypothetical protein
MEEVQCIICLRSLEQDEHGLVNDGGFADISFHYGSTLDMMIGFEGRTTEDKDGLQKLLSCDKIEAFICDDCFKERWNLCHGFIIDKVEQMKYTKRIM